LPLTMVISHFMAQPRFHAGPYTSHFKTSVAAVGTSYKIADNMFLVP